LAGIRSCVVTGPLLDPEVRADLEARAAKLPEVTLLPFCEDLVSYVHAADLVVTMGGYNSICEVVEAGKRTIVVPRVHPRKEQLIRAERLRDLGAVAMIHPDDLTPDALAREVARGLVGPAPSPVLDFGGLRRAGDVVVEALANGKRARAVAHG